jgi:hypothetical protein
MKAADPSRQGRKAFRIGELWRCEKTSVDRIEGELKFPGTLHRYSYVTADPINKVDPAGEQEVSISGTLVAANISATMDLAATLYVVSQLVELECKARGVPGVFDPCRPWEEKTVFRGLTAKGPRQFRFDADGLSAFERRRPTYFDRNRQKFIPYRFRFPFRIKFNKPLLPGTIALVVAPPVPLGGIAIYTPTEDADDHWSINPIVAKVGRRCEFQAAFSRASL